MANSLRQHVLIYITISDDYNYCVIDNLLFKIKIFEDIFKIIIVFFSPSGGRI